MKTWTFVLINFVGFVCAARRNNLESSGYDSNNNWPASLVIDTAHLPDSSSQHDLFYGGGSVSSTQRAFEHEERPQTAQVEQRVPSTTTQSLNNQSNQSTTTPTSRPEFTPTNTQLGQTNKPTSAFNQDEEEEEEDHTTRSQNFPTPGEFGERRTIHENPTTISSQFDAYNQVNTGRPRQNFYPAESIDGRRFGQSTSRPNQQQFNRKTTLPSSRFQSNIRGNGQQNEYEQVEFAASQDNQRQNERTTTLSRDNQRTQQNRRTNPSINEYESSPTVHVSQDSRQGLMISSTNGDDGINRDFSVDNRNNHRTTPQTGYESQAVFSPIHDSNQQKEVVDSEQARLVAKLLNIDRISSYTLDADDARSESVDRFENSTVIQGPPSPFSNETEFKNETIGEINEILTRPLNASDQPFEDKNLRQATLEIIKLLHDEPTGQQQKEPTKGGKKIRVIRLPPMSSEEDSEEIVLVGERGNATIHRGRNTMFIHATSQKRRA